MNEAEEQLAGIAAADRVLLMPHCLRRADTCQGKYNSRGLECQECNPECPVNRLRRLAVKMGYRGVCVAPGGRLAVNYVKESRPRAVVAVACAKELEEGVHGVRAIAGDKAPLMVVIPLSKDGCVDTEVDEGEAARIIGLGCPVEAKTDTSGHLQ